MKFEFRARRPATSFWENAETSAAKVVSKGAAHWLKTNVGSKIVPGVVGVTISRYASKGLEKGEKGAKVLKHKIQDKPAPVETAEPKKKEKQLLFVTKGGLPIYHERDARIHAIMAELDDVRNLWREPIQMAQGNGVVGKTVRGTEKVLGGAAKLGGKALKGGFKAATGLGRPKVVNKTVTNNYYKPQAPSAPTYEGYDPKLMAESIRAYFDSVMDVLAQVVEQMKGETKEFTSQELATLSKILTDGILDYSDSMSHDRMLSLLQKVFINRAATEAMSPGTILKAAVLAGSGIGAVVAGLQGIFWARKQVNQMVSSKKLLKMKFSQDRELKHLFDTKIIPGLTKVVDRVVHQDIKTLEHLGSEMYPLLEKVYAYRPELEKYLTLWKPFNA